MKHLVVGSKGEIGSAILSLLINNFKEVWAVDLDLPIPPDLKVDIIHICIRDSDRFDEIVLDYARRHGSDGVYLVIHSTPKPYTTARLSKKINNVIYSPVRGSHPDLFNDLLKFTKYFASDFDEALAHVVKLFQFAGLKTKIVPNPTNLEFAKHYSTTMLGASLVITQEIFMMKDNYDLDPEVIMEFINDTGAYTRDRKIYPYIEGIGGHCVIPNAKALSQFSSLAVYVLKFNKFFIQKYPGKNYKLKGNFCPHEINLYIEICTKCEEKTIKEMGLEEMYGLDKE
jgi:hypothetical protein